MALTKISTDGVKDDAVTAGKIPANAVGSSELADNAVDNAAVASNAAIAGSKISPDFGSQNITTTGNLNGKDLTLTNTQPAINLIDSDNNPDYKIRNSNGGFIVTDTTNSVNRIIINPDGHIDIANNVDFAAGIDVTGTCTATSFAGDGSNLTGITSTTINNNADNRVITGSGTANTLEGEANLTYTGDILSLGGQSNLNGVRITNTTNVPTLLQFSAARAAATNTIGLIDAKWNNNHTVSRIDFRAGSDTTNKDDGMISFYTAPDSATGVKEAMRIRNDGTVAISNINNHGGNSGINASMIIDSRTDGGHCGLYVKGHGQQAGTASPHAAIRISETGAANNATEMIGLDNVTTQSYVQAAHGIKTIVTGSYATTYGVRSIMNKNVGAYTNGYNYYSNIVQTNSGGSSYHFLGQNNGSDRIRIELGGNVKNTNNSYGSLSDIKFKENIVDANSQWNDIKAVKVRNFNFKSSTKFETHKQIGVIAQELETVSAGLIDTTNDIEVDATTGEGKVTGTTKYVKYSILYMKALKALQEAMAKIEVLETKVAALEAG